MLPLLRTKTSIPPARPGQVQRMRLIDRVQAGMQRALTLVVAPAGYGKTTLAAAWAARANMPVAWLTLQQADRPPARFLSYVIQALQQVAPRTGQTSLALLAGVVPENTGNPVESALAALVDDLSELDHAIGIVLDDYHTVDCLETGALLRFLLENKPAALHLAITSRTAPTIPLARLRALGQVTEIGMDDLRFQTGEARDFLKDCMGIELNQGEFDDLETSTEGWAAGLQLAALALARSPAAWRAPDTHSRIFEYMAEEVLQRESPQVQEFLAKTSLFDRFSPALCARLVPGGAALLRYVEQANLFLSALDAQATWFRYHPIFTEFLRGRLDPAETAPLYQAASQWFEENGFADDAIHYALSSGDTERAALLLEQNYRALLQRGEQSLLIERLSDFPEDVFDRYPRLWLARGWAFMVTMNSDGANDCIQRAEAHISPGAAGDKLRGEAQALRLLTQVFSGRFVNPLEIERALNLFSGQDDFLYSLLRFNLGLNAVMNGETELAIDAFNETLRLTKSLNNPLVTIIAWVQLGETRLIRGALGMADRAYQQVIRYTKDTLGERSFLLGMPYVSYADLLRERNQFDDAVHYATEGIRLCQIWLPIAGMDGMIALARISASQGRLEDAFKLLEQVVQVAEGSVTVLDDTYVAIHRAKLYMLHGNVGEARFIIESYELEAHKDQMYYYMREQVDLILARVHVFDLMDFPHEVSAVIQELVGVIDAAEQRGRISAVIEGLLLRAYALQVSGDLSGAVVYLGRALTLGAQSGYMRLLADEGERLLKLIEQNRGQIQAPRAYVDRIIEIMRSDLLKAIDQTSTNNSGKPALEANPIPLTRRELDILRQMADGLTNQEIANESVLALNTVKKHVANILSKLEVANRTQAVIAAKKAGWLSIMDE